jgi:hypothetical protein
LLSLGPQAGYLINYDPEVLEISTWAFDISLVILIAIILVEQFKLGYNPQNKSWPRWSFYWVFVCIGAGLIALAIQALTYGFNVY